MLALVLAVSMELCPICGNYDGIALYNNQVVQMHSVEDARPGDIYTICTECEQPHTVEFMGYIY